jgi:hypothetical protein
LSDDPLWGTAKLMAAITPVQEKKVDGTWREPQPEEMKAGAFWVWKRLGLDTRIIPATGWAYKTIAAYRAECVCSLHRGLSLICAALQTVGCTACILLLLWSSQLTLRCAFHHSTASIIVDRVISINNSCRANPHPINTVFRAIPRYLVLPDVYPHPSCGSVEGKKQDPWFARGALLPLQRRLGVLDKGIKRNLVVWAGRDHGMRSLDKSRETQLHDEIKKAIASHNKRCVHDTRPLLTRFTTTHLFDAPLSSSTITTITTITIINGITHTHTHTHTHSLARSLTHSLARSDNNV